MVFVYLSSYRFSLVWERCRSSDHVPPPFLVLWFHVSPGMNPISAHLIWEAGRVLGARDFNPQQVPGSWLCPTKNSKAHWSKAYPKQLYCQTNVHTPEEAVWVNSENLSHPGQIWGSDSSYRWLQYGHEILMGGSGNRHGFPRTLRNIMHALLATMCKAELDFSLVDTP